MKDEQRSTFDKSNPIYSKEKNMKRKSSQKGTASANDVSAANQGGSGIDLQMINSDLKNVKESIEVEVRVGDR